MKFGFYITKVQCEGLEVPPASLLFVKGSNLVTGASDTGKSYVFSVINYVLGRSKEPKDLPESIGYNSYFLEIRAFSDNAVYTLRREKDKNRIAVKNCEQKVFATDSSKVFNYRATGSAKDEPNISDFLLSLCQLSDKKMLSSKEKGITQRLTFPQINKLTTVPEDRIITEESPFYPSAQVISRTPEQSLLRLLLTGEDFSEVTPREDKEKKETSILGKLEYIDSQLTSLVGRREELLKVLEQATSSPQDTITIESLQTQLHQNLEASKTLLQRKSRIIAVRQRYTDGLAAVEILASRFSILHQQYVGDRKRLEFVLEAENLSSQLGDVLCPICASPLDGDNIGHIAELQDFKAAANQEIYKIDLKLADLTNSQVQLRERSTRLKTRLEKVQTGLMQLEKDLQEDLAPAIAALQSSLSSYVETENRKSQIKLIDEQIEGLYATKARLEQVLNEKTEEEEITIIDYAPLSELSRHISTRLRNWNYEQQVNVTFDSSYKVFDIVISGKSRRSYGKGKRAISFAGCLLGILDFCLLKNKAFSQLIILDSPLTTFEEKKRQPTADILSTSILNAFFSDLGKTPDDCQIIIFDNKIPQQTIPGLNVQVFTGEPTTGRAGFFE